MSKVTIEVETDAGQYLKVTRESRGTANPLIDAIYRVDEELQDPAVTLIAEAIAESAEIKVLNDGCEPLR